MSVTLARLRAIVTAVAVLLLGMTITTGPASAVDGTLPDGYYLCHATSSASSPEDVKNWVTNSPSDSGQASGHAGAGHQNGLDVIPPIPGVLPQGQNWTAYGEQVHALGCRVPVDPEVSFADSDCVNGNYVAPTGTAPTYTGLNRQTSGSVAPGQTWTVTYTAKPGYGIVGPSTFTHTFAAFPAGQADCARPQPDVRRVPGSSSSCAAPAGVTSWVDVFTTPYAWDAGQRRWVAGQESGPVRTDETFTAYTDQQYFDACAGDRPAADERRVPGSQPSCALGGVTSWVDVFTTPYTWVAGQRRWVKGAETGPVRADETFTAYPDQEYFTKCAPAQPAADVRREPMADPSCALGGVTSWTDVYRTEYVWNAQQREWVAGDETGPVRVDEEFTAYSDAGYQAACGGNQPAPDVREVPMTDPSCAPAGVTSWTDVYATPYLWSTQQRDWVAGTETGPVRVGESFTAYTDQEFFDACAPAQPAAEQRREPMAAPSCALGGVTSWLDVYTTASVWDLQQRTWVKGAETGPVRTAESFTAYTDDEYFATCAPAKPDAAERREPGSDPSCALGGVTSWTDVWTTPYVWDNQLRDWVPGTEAGPVRDGEGFTAYTDQEYFDLCAAGYQPTAQQRRVPMSDPSCALGGVTSWIDVYTTAYVWDAQQRDWVLGPETGPVRTAEDFTAYTDDEYFTTCAPAQPDADQRREPRSDPSCAPSGVTSWTDVWTTPSLWSSQLRDWVPGTETGPVRVGETFTAYTDDEYFAECAPVQPDADQRRVPVADPSCARGGVTSWTDVFTTAYIWDPQGRTWVRGDETGPVRVDEAFTAYSDADYRAVCGGEQPAPDVRQVPMSDPSCAPAGVTSWTDVFTTPYVWSPQLRDWVAGPETGPVRVGETFTAYSDEEFFDACAPVQPDAEVREESGTDESCVLHGRTSWTHTWTTAYVWDAGQRAWVLGTEGDPVRTEEFVRYTAAEYEAACVDLEGEEDTDDDRPHTELAPAPRDETEVRGRQATAVPTVVDAGRMQGPVGSGTTGDRRWLLALGLLTFALAGARRRPTTRR